MEDRKDVKDEGEGEASRPAAMISLNLSDKSKKYCEACGRLAVHNAKSLHPEHAPVHSDVHIHTHKGCGLTSAGGLRAQSQRKCLDLIGVQ